MNASAIYRTDSAIWDFVIVNEKQIICAEDSGKVVSVDLAGAETGIKKQ